MHVTPPRARAHSTQLLLAFGLVSGLAPAIAVGSAAASDRPTPAPVAARQGDSVAARQGDNAVNFIATYHRSPAPAAAETLIRSQLATPALDSPTSRMRLVGFLAGLISTTPSLIDTLAPAFRSLPGDQPLRLARAIAYSGRPDWSLHTARLKNLWPEHARDIEQLSAKGGRPIPTLADTRSALVIDLAWGFYGATGRTDAIERIIAALPTHKTTLTAEHLLVAQAARWQLSTALKSDDRVRAIAQDHLDGPHGEALRDLLKTIGR